jgi:hypothetical protein
MPSMSAALCFHCGSMKEDPFVACRACGRVPQTEEDLVYSMAMTERILPRDQLELISQSMQEGHPRPGLAEDLAEDIRRELRKYSAILALLVGTPPGAPKIPVHALIPERTTPEEATRWLSEAAPRSFEKAEDVIAVFRKYRAGRGLFRSRKPLRKALFSELHSLREMAVEEGYRPDLNEKPVELVLAFFYECWDARRDWRPDLTASGIDELVMQCFGAAR